MALVTHSDRCSGCRACALVCALTNFGENNPKYGAIRIVGHFPSPGTFEVRVCTQCGACMDACPVGAISRKDNGFYEVDQDTCVGCGLCVEACPEGVARMIPANVKAFLCTGCGECVKYCPKEAIQDSLGEVTRI